MKRTIKTISVLLLALTLVMGLTGNVFAADSTVIFKGLDEGFAFGPGSSYTDSDLFDNFKGVMPGDKLIETVEVKNEATDCDYIKLYLRAEVHDEQSNPLSSGVAESGETVATMSDFLAQLAMKVYNGSDLIYDAVPDQLDGLAENVLLGTFRSGEATTLTVELDVPADLGNEYANRVGEVDWVFVIEAFDDPTPPPPDYTQITVRKVWDDQNDPNRPDHITAKLLRDGEDYAEVELSEANNWTYTWSELDKNSKWSVVEKEVPFGYTASYETVGNVTTITNTKEGEPLPPPVDPDPVSLTVKKTWSGDEDHLSTRPTSVGITLYNGKTAVETVKLGEWNNWTYTWDDLDGNGNWSVLEVDIPKGYTPSYQKDGTVITVTNTATLIQTGQINWPIPVLSGLGVLMVGFGLFVILRKKKSEAK